MTTNNYHTSWHVLLPSSKVEELDGISIVAIGARGHVVDEGEVILTGDTCNEEEGEEEDKEWFHHHLVVVVCLSSSSLVLLWQLSGKYLGICQAKL